MKGVLIVYSILFTICSILILWQVILAFLFQDVIIAAEIVFEILQNYTLTESQQFILNSYTTRNGRKRAYIYLRRKIRLGEYEE